MACRDVLWRTLVREKLQLDGRRWTLQRQLAVFSKGAADWSSPRTQTTQGNVWVYVLPASPPSPSRAPPPPPLPPPCYDGHASSFLRVDNVVAVARSGRLAELTSCFRM